MEIYRLDDFYTVLKEQHKDYLQPDNIDISAPMMGKSNTDTSVVVRSLPNSTVIFKYSIRYNRIDIGSIELKTDDLDIDKSKTYNETELLEYFNKATGCDLTIDEVSVEIKYVPLKEYNVAIRVKDYNYKYTGQANFKISLLPEIDVSKEHVIAFPDSLECREMYLIDTETQELSTVNINNIVGMREGIIEHIHSTETGTVHLYGKFDITIIDIHGTKDIVTDSIVVDKLGTVTAMESNLNVTEPIRKVYMYKQKYTIIADAVNTYRLDKSGNIENILKDHDYDDFIIHGCSLIYYHNDKLEYKSKVYKVDIETLDIIDSWTIECLSNKGNYVQPIIDSIGIDNDTDTIYVHIRSSVDNNMFKVMISNKDYINVHNYDNPEVDGDIYHVYALHDYTQKLHFHKHYVKHSNTFPVFHPGEKHLLFTLRPNNITGNTGYVPTTLNRESNALDTNHLYATTYNSLYNIVSGKDSIVISGVTLDGPIVGLYKNHTEYTFSIDVRHLTYL